MSDDVNSVILRCSAGCLEHVVGITHFNLADWETDEPEMYFETLHSPYEGFWMRLWRAWQFVVQKKPIGVDSTLIGVTEAQKMIDVCNEYILDHIKWEEMVKSTFVTGKTMGDMILEWLHDIDKAVPHSMAEETIKEIERLNGIINVLGNNIESLNGHIDKLEHIQDK